MPRARHLLKPALSALIVLCTGFFFYKAFQRNWDSVRAHDFRVAPGFLVGSALCILASSLLATLAWYTALNTLSPSKIDFRQSVAAVNASSLTKYIPGKIWSYALQMYWLDGLGISKGLIVYVNLVNLLISLGMTLVFGCVCLLFAHGPIPIGTVLAVLLVLLVVDACTVLYYRGLLNWLVSTMNRWLKRNFAFFEVQRSLLLKLHVIHFGAALTAGLGVYLFCFAIGYRIEFERALMVIGSSAVGDVVGFLAVIVPGGLGVREGLMYAMLGGQATGSLSLVLPVASRLLSMFVDVALGAVALKLLRSLTARKRAPA